MPLYAMPCPDSLHVFQRFSNSENEKYSYMSYSNAKGKVTHSLKFLKLAVRMLVKLLHHVKHDDENPED